MDILLNFIHPAGQLPECTGPFKTIGTRELWWRHPVPCDEQDADQQCINLAQGNGICSNEMHKHGLLVKIWYPVSRGRLYEHCPRAEYVRDRSNVSEGNEMSRVIKRMMRPMPGFLVDYYLRVRTNSLLDAPIWCHSDDDDGSGSDNDHHVSSSTTLASVTDGENTDGGEDHAAATASGANIEENKNKDEEEKSSADFVGEIGPSSNATTNGENDCEKMKSRDDNDGDGDTVAADRLPVIIFSHGMYGIPEFYSAYCENLASNGYLVIAPYHTDQSAMHVIYPDGKTRILFGKKPETYMENPVLMQQEYEERRKQLQERIENVMFVLDTLAKIDEIEMEWPEVKEALREYNEAPDGMDIDDGGRAHGQEDNNNFRELTSRERDVLWMKRTDGALFLKGHFDSLRVGIVGHSFGACTALASMLHEQAIDKRRLLSGISFDGWFFPLRDISDSLVHNNPLTRPFFFINSSHWQWKENIDRMYFFLRNMNWYQMRLYEEKMGIQASNDMNDDAMEHADGDGDGDSRMAEYEWLDLYGSIYVINETLHQNFSDIAVMMPRFGKRIRSLGKADPLSALQEQLIIMNRFLKYHVKLKKDPTLRLLLQQYWFRIERHDMMLRKYSATGETATHIIVESSQQVSGGANVRNIRYKQGGIPARELLKVTSLVSPPSPIQEEYVDDQQQQQQQQQQQHDYEEEVEEGYEDEQTPQMHYHHHPHHRHHQFHHRQSDD